MIRMDPTYAEETVQHRLMADEASNDYTKYGIKNAPKYTTSTPLGKTKTFAGLFAKEWIFLIVSVINICTAIGLTVYSMIHLIQKNPALPDFTFTLLLLINAGFCMFYVLHGVLRERVYELYAFIAAILVVLMYCLLEYFAFNVNGHTPVKLARLILACVLAPPNIIMTLIVVKSFGYLEFKIVGASEALQRLYRQAAVFSCLLKFDLQASCSIVMLALKDGTDISVLETWSLAIGLPFSLLWCLLGWASMRRESVKGVYVFAVLGVLKPAYYLYKVIREYTQLTDDSHKSDNYVVYALIAAVSLGMLVWLMLMVELVWVYRNFGKGLKDRGTLEPSENTGLLSGTRQRLTL